LPLAGLRESSFARIQWMQRALDPSLRAVNEMLAGAQQS